MSRARFYFSQCPRSFSTASAETSHTQIGSNLLYRPVTLLSACKQGTDTSHVATWESLFKARGKGLTYKFYSLHSSSCWMCGAELGAHKLQTVSWGNRTPVDGKQHVKTGNKMARAWLFPSKTRSISSKLGKKKKRKNVLSWRLRAHVWRLFYWTSWRLWKRFLYPFICLEFF